MIKIVNADTMNGKELKDKILGSGFELKKVAETLNITPQDLNSKLNSTDIKVDFLKRVAKAINKTVYELMEEKIDVNTDVNTDSNTEENSNPMDDKERVYLQIIQDCARAAADSATAAKSSAATAEKILDRVPSSQNRVPNQAHGVEDNILTINAKFDTLLDLCLPVIAKELKKDPLQLRTELGNKTVSLIDQRRGDNKAVVGNRSTVES